MLSFERTGNTGPLLVLLHWLGGSSRTWQAVANILSSRGIQCVALDLPGFGQSSSTAGYSVSAMSEAVAETIRSLRAGSEAEPWLIGGHSMGCKVAQVVARKAADRAVGLENLRGAFLISASPSTPEPMDEGKREKMLQQLGESTGNPKEDRKRAQTFVDDNTGKLPLPEALHRLAIDDLLRMNRTAFRAWFEHGSKEDWSGAVGILPIPACILTGSEEPALGADTQREKTLPHFRGGTVVQLQGGGHIAPLERPFEVAEYACSFLRDLGLPMQASAAALGVRSAELLESKRVSAHTRAVMEARLAHAATWNGKPTVLSDDEFRTMRALAECVVPHAEFDVAEGIEERLATGNGDGWRFAALPTDVEAWRKGFASLDAAAERHFHVPFVALHATQQRELLRSAAEGKLGNGLLGALHIGAGAEAFSREEIKLWIEEVRGDFAKCYMAHPSTMERIGFSGFANEPGFTQIRLGQQEDFER